MLYVLFFMYESESNIKICFFLFVEMILAYFLGTFLRTQPNK